MWKYENNKALYHSDTYLGKDFSDGIKHWKYIKREKKNGRWIYYYNPDNYKEEYEKATSNIDKHYINQYNKNKNYDYKKDKEYARLAKDWNKAKKNYYTTQGFGYNNIKGNISYSAVKVLNKISKFKYDAKKSIKGSKILKQILGK